MISEIVNTDKVVLLAGILFISGVLATKFSSRFGVPSLVFFMLVGMLMGNDILGIIHFNNASTAQMIGVLALIIILFQGGLETRWKTLRPVIVPSLSLATLGVILTTSIVAIAARYIFDLDWLVAFLFGSIVGSTDAAAVFTVLKGQNINPRIGAVLESESGSNDPMAVLLTIATIEMITLPNANISSLIGSFFLQLTLGVIMGGILGLLAVMALNRINLDSSGLYPVFATAFALLTYGITAFLGGSGLLAVYIAAIIIGNSEIVYRHSVFRFSEGFAWMMQISMFVILGLLVNPSELFTWNIIWKGMVLSFILMFISRPIAVIISTYKMKFTKNETIFLSWAGLKGAVPIVLATFPLLANVPGSQQIFNLVFFVVLTSCLIQGSTITSLAKKLKLVGTKKVEPLHSLELISLGKADAEMIEFELDENTAIVGKSLLEIPFPNDSLVNAIIRDEQVIPPTGSTLVKAGDFLYILTSRKNKHRLKKLLQQKKPELSDQLI